MAKKRNMFLCVLFSIITFGIYWIYWWCKVTTETNHLATNHKTANGIVAWIFSLITAGIYYFYWAYKMGCKVKEINGEEGGGTLYIILSIFGFGFLINFFAQSAINNKVDQAPATAA